ncbi:MAG: hypothetical protein J0J01_13350 [Reyranella sp.]|uniref:hypothetical protein n=1 Tax=Reyranella sp. TaxID=1929291 RepID=UPI001AD5EB0A|nr:hypothetical protein [Reyranella sp.]MBN9087891.1 hypothetical protein [Reyranella sp.]
MAGKRFWAWASGVALVVVSFAASAQDKLPVPPGGDPALACGQKPDGRSYWLEYGFCDQPMKGPAVAKGLILLNHGVNRDLPQYQFPVPPVVARLVRDGWDVVKLNRNNLYESCRNSSGTLLNCWTAGTKHVDELIARAQQAKAQGYQRLIAAGQSFGGAIAVEANARAPGLFHGVLATAPGHGSDAPTGGSSSTSGTYPVLDKQILDTLAAQKNGRIVLAFPPNDKYHPNRDGDPIWPKARQVLQGTGRPFVLFGEGLPVNGHGAGTTPQFDAWFGDCIRNFMDPAQAPAGEVRCPPPASLPTFLLPAGLMVPPPGGGPARFLGRWQGKLDQINQQALIVVDQVNGDTASYIYALDAGPNREFNMVSIRYAARIEGDRLKPQNSAPPLNEIALQGQSLSLKRSLADGRVLTGTLTRQP